MPKKPKAEPETADYHYSVNVTPSERQLIDRAAMLVDDEKRASRWIRKVALRAAREALGEGK